MSFYSGKNKDNSADINAITTQVASNTSSLAEKASKDRLNDIVINVKDYGAKGDGVLDNQFKYVSGTDDTASIQSAIDYASSIGGGTVKIPKGTYIVNGTTKLVMKTNVNISMDDNTIIKALPNPTATYSIFYFNNVQNIEVVKGKVIGERYDHIGTTGDTGHGFNIKGSKNIRIKETTVRDCWGDGFIITYDALSYSDTLKVWYSEDITLQDCISDNNRRQGLSIITGKNINIIRGKYMNTNGTSPQAGIDIEPDPTVANVPSGSLGPILENINIDNAYTEKNTGAGIQIYNDTIVNTNKTVSIKINKHTDKGSNNGLVLGKTDGTLKGFILVENPTYQDNKLSAINITNYSINAPRIDIVNPVIKDANRNNNQTLPYGAAIIIQNDVDTGITGLVGNVHISKPWIINTTNTKPNVAIYIWDRKNSGNFISNVDIIDPINLDGLIVYANYQGIFSDVYNITLKETTITTATTISSNQYEVHKKTTNKGSTQTLTVALSGGYAENFPELEFQCVSNATLKINPPTGGSILPLGVTGQSLQTNQIGAKIVVRKASGSDYYVTNIIGTWTAV
jgi:hypothetical protein